MIGVRLHILSILSNFWDLKRDSSTNIAQSERMLNYAWTEQLLYLISNTNADCKFQYLKGRYQLFTIIN